MHFLELPDVLLIEIFEHFNYEEVSKKRLICRRLDQICQHVLNCGFNKIIRKHALSFKRIKSMLPRRESERRNHSLARHADILTSIETRISMLSMTYSKYIDLHLCCFIPGRVLDEMLRILKLISKTSKPLRPHEVLQELRDISSMAIEHFDEKIAISLKKSIVVASSGGVSHSFGVVSTDCNSRLPSSALSNIIVHNQSCISSLKPSNHNQQCKCWNRSELANNEKLPETLNCQQARNTSMEFKKLELEHKKLNIKLQQMQLKQTHQGRRLQQALSSISEQNAQIIDLKKRLEDLDAKNREISANFKQQITSGETVNSSDASSTTISLTSKKVYSAISESAGNKRSLENIPNVAADLTTIMVKKRRV